MKSSDIYSYSIDFYFFKRTVILLLAVCLFCVVAPNRIEAAIAFDNSTSSSGASSLSWTHNVIGGSDRIVLVGISWRNSGDNVSDVSAISYGGTNIIGNLAVKRTRFGDPPGSKSSAIYYMVNPPIGNSTVSVSFQVGIYRCAGGAISLTGVDQTSPIDATNSAFADSGSPASVTVTTTVDNAWVIDTLALRQVSSPPSVVGQTQAWINGSLAMVGAGSYEGPKMPAGDVTMSWTLPANEGHSICAVSLKPASSNSAPNMPH